MIRGDVPVSSFSGMAGPGFGAEVAGGVLEDRGVARVVADFFVPEPEWAAWPVPEADGFGGLCLLVVVQLQRRAARVPVVSRRGRLSFVGFMGRSGEG